MPVTNSKLIAVSVGATRNAAIDMSGILDDGELLSSITSISEVTSADLTITNKAVSTTSQVINGKTVAIGKAVQFTVSGHSATGGQDDAGKYRIRVTAATDAGQTIVEDFLIKAV